MPNDSCRAEWQGRQEPWAHRQQERSCSMAGAGHNMMQHTGPAHACRCLPARRRCPPAHPGEARCSVHRSWNRPEQCRWATGRQSGLADCGGVTFKGQPAWHGATARALVSGRPLLQCRLPLLPSHRTSGRRMRAPLRSWVAHSSTISPSLSITCIIGEQPGSVVKRSSLWQAGWPSLRQGNHCLQVA